MRVQFIMCAFLWWAGCSETSTNLVRPTPTASTANTGLFFYYQADLGCCPHGCAERESPVEVCATSLAEADALVRAAFPHHNIFRMAGPHVTTAQQNQQIQNYNSECTPVKLEAKEALAYCPQPGTEPVLPH